jgi:hypothetical protein
MAEQPATLFDPTITPEPWTPADLFDAEEQALEAAAATQAVPSPEDPPPWERQKGETTKAFHAFMHFRAQPPHFHSCKEAYRDHLKTCLQAPWPSAGGSEVDPDHLLEAPKHWRMWSSQWGWMERVAAWDEEVDRLARAKLMAAQVEARERHVRLAQAMLLVLSLPIKAAVEAAKDPTLVEKLTAGALADTAGAQALIRDVAKLAGVVPSIVAMERLALGLSTEAVTLAPPSRDDHAFAFADRIASDPAATALAVQLLDRLSDAGPSLALGTGVSGEPGDMADSAALESAHEETG